LKIDEIMDRQYIDLIHDVYPSLSPGEKQVADYIIENLTDVLRMSSRELCNAINVSEPTLFRFCKTLGFTGFRDLKISMAQQITSFKDYFSAYEAAESRLQTLVREALQSEIKVIDTTLKMIDYTLLEKTAKRILATERICLFGAGDSVESCNAARRKFSRLGISVWSYSDFHEALTILGSFTKKDMLIAVSHTGNTTETENILRFAFNRKIFNVLLTAYPNTQMGSYAKIILRTYTRETIDNRIVGASRISQLAMIDALFIAVGSMLHDDKLQIMEQTSRDIKKALKNK